MVLGRLLFGFCCGVIIFAGQKMLEETVPSNQVSHTSAINMVFLFLGVLTSMLIGLILPGENDLEGQKATKLWRIPFGLQYLCEVLLVMGFEAFYPEDSVTYNILKGNDTQALKMIKRIYPKNENCDRVLEDLKKVGVQQKAKMDYLSPDQYESLNSDSYKGSSQFRTPVKFRER